MKKVIRNAILSVFFALCCVFGILSISNSSIVVNATENENQEVVEEEKEQENTEENTEEQEKEEEKTEEEKTEEEKQETEENTENETTEDETTEDDVIKETEELNAEIEKLLVYIISALGALGVSWGSIATVVKWLKNKISQANKEVVNTAEQLKDAKNRICELTEIIEKQLEENDELRESLNGVKDLLSDFLNCEKEKAETIKQVVNEVLPNEKKEDESNEIN